MGGDGGEDRQAMFLSEWNATSVWRAQRSQAVDSSGERAGRGLGDRIGGFGGRRAGGSRVTEWAISPVSWMMELLRGWPSVSSD
nr:unnamed protein product [Digitaria exilis]